MKKKILFYAPVGTGVPQHQLGGGEIGCRRTSEILTDAGYEVITIDKPVMGNGLTNYLKMAIKAYMKVLSLLLSEKDSILYVVGFYEKNIFLEWLNVMTGKLLSHKVIYEARNGRLVKAYFEYGNLYKWLMNSILEKANLIFAQGLEFIEFIYERYEKNAIYTPNYVMNRNVKPYSAERSFETLRLIYFGRVSKSKNVGTVILTAACLKRRGYKTETVIIGEYTEEYKKELDILITIEGIPSYSVIFKGQQSFDIISEELQKAHFFIFPSQEKMEGHSNSLTEAMTFGVIPVASSAGFNAGIISKCELVINEINPGLFAEAIDNILKAGSWKEYSQFVYKRVIENYTEDIVRQSILDAIDSLL